MLRQLLRSGAIVFLGILVGRIAGLAREWLVARQFGSTHQADIAVVLITIPDTLLSVLIGGAMGAALIPEFQSREGVNSSALYRQSLRATFLSALPFVILLAVLAPWVVRAFAPHLDANTATIAAQALPLMLVTIPFTCVAAVDRAFLQSRSDFAVSAFSTAVYNIGLVVGLVVMMTMPQWWVLSLGAIGGAALSWIMQWRRSARYQAQEHDQVRQAPKQIDRALVFRYIQAVAAGGIMLLIAPAARARASTYGEGSLALYNYASKLIDLPLGTVLTVFSVVLFPVIVGKLANPDSRESGIRVARMGLAAVMVTAVGIACAFAIFAPDFSRAIFGYGKLQESTNLIAPSVAVLTLALVAQACHSILIVVFSAIRDMRTPFLCSCAAMATFFLVAPITERAYGFLGIAAAFGIAHTLLLFSLGFVALRVHKLPVLSGLISPSCLVATSVCAGVSLLLGWPLAQWRSSHWIHVLAAMAICVIAILLAFAAAPDFRRYLNPRNLRKMRASTQS
jgi:murein biosynthesis integral membrane protein MurJ